MQDYTNQQTANAQMSTISEVKKREIKDYEQEINALRAKIKQKQKAQNQRQETAEKLIGQKVLAAMNLKWYEVNYQRLIDGINYYACELKQASQLHDVSDRETWKTIQQLKNGKLG